MLTIVRMDEMRSTRVIKLFNSFVYPLTIACLGFISYKTIIGDYDVVFGVAVALNIIALLVYNYFAKREFRVISLLASTALLASTSWVLYLVSMRQLLVFVLLLPYLAWTIYAEVGHIRSIRRHPHPA